MEELLGDRCQIRMVKESLACVCSENATSSLSDEALSSSEPLEAAQRIIVGSHEPQIAADFVGTRQHQEYP